MRIFTALLFASFLTAACDSSVEDDEPVGGGSPELDEAGCPVDKPADGGTCTDANKVCEYLELVPDALDCDEAVRAVRCEDSAWVEYEWQCNCPEALPEAGADCLGYHATSVGCVYTTACGEDTANANCGSHTDYVWEVSLAAGCTEP